MSINDINVSVFDEEPSANEFSDLSLTRDTVSLNVSGSMSLCEDSYDYLDEFDKSTAEDFDSNTRRRLKLKYVFKEENEETVQQKLHKRVGDKVFRDFLLAMEATREAYFSHMSSRTSMRDLLHFIREMTDKVEREHYSAHMKGYIKNRSTDISLMLNRDHTGDVDETVPFTKFKRHMVHPDDQIIVEVLEVDYSCLFEYCRMRHSFSVFEFESVLQMVMVALAQIRGAILDVQDRNPTIKHMAETTQLQKVKILLLNYIIDRFELPDLEVVEINQKVQLAFSKKASDWVAGTEEKRVTLHGYGDLAVITPDSDLIASNIKGLSEAKKDHSILSAGSATNAYAGTRNQPLAQSEAVQLSVGGSRMMVNVVGDLFSAFAIVSKIVNGRVIHITTPRTTNLMDVVLLYLMMLMGVDEGVYSCFEPRAGLHEDVLHLVTHREEGAAGGGGSGGEYSPLNISLGSATNRSSRSNSTSSDGSTTSTSSASRSSSSSNSSKTKSASSRHKSKDSHRSHRSNSKEGSGSVEPNPVVRDKGTEQVPRSILKDVSNACSTASTLKEHQELRKKDFRFGENSVQLIYPFKENVENVESVENVENVAA